MIQSSVNLKEKNNRSIIKNIENKIFYITVQIKFNHKRTKNVVKILSMRREKKTNLSIAYNVVL